MGEIKLHAKDPGAKQDFAQALQLIESVAKPDLHTEEAKAHLLYRLGEIARATELYAALLARRPEDKDLRADYATMLIDLGKVDEARALLQNVQRAVARRSSTWRVNSSAQPSSVLPS
jgi:predicted Zn-dependent protease